MEQEVRVLLEEHVADRRPVLEQIEQAWTTQRRQPAASQIDRWIRAGRS
jgi:hypothetical protein